MRKSMLFDVEDISKTWDELDDLIRAHRIEVRGDSDFTVPDCDRYNTLSREGRLLFFTVRDSSTLELVGYSTMVISSDIQKLGETNANQDSIYIRNSHRIGFAGGHFFQYIERECAFRGIKTIYQSTTPSRDFGTLLQRLGYTECTKIFSKQLG